MRRLMALALIEDGQLEPAEQALVQACAEPEEDTENRMADLGNLAIVWHLQGRLDAAINAWQRLLERIGNGRLRVPALAHLASACADDGRLDLAVSALAEARAKAAPVFEPFLRLCAAVVDLGQGSAGGDETSLAAAIARARSELRAVTRPGPAGSPSAVRRDQDLNIGRMLLERSLARAERAAEHSIVRMA